MTQRCSRIWPRTSTIVWVFPERSTTTATMARSAVSAGKHKTSRCTSLTGEAYNVEMGITNLLFPQDRPLPGEDGGGSSGLTGFPPSCLNLSGGGFAED